MCLRLCVRDTPPEGEQAGADLRDCTQIIRGELMPENEESCGGVSIELRAFKLSESWERLLIVRSLDEHVV